MIRLTKLRRPLRSGLIAAFILGMLPTVQAAELPTIRVYVGDLALQDPRGQRELQRRVDSAIHRVCQPATPDLLSSPRARRLARQCRASAWTDVQEQLARHNVAMPTASLPTVTARSN